MLSLPLWLVSQPTDGEEVQFLWLKGFIPHSDGNTEPC